MQRPPPLQLDATHTTAAAPPGFQPAIPTTDPNRYTGVFGTPLSPVRYQQVLQNFIAPLEAEYQARTVLIPQTIEADLAAARLEGSTQPLPPAASILRELGVRNTVIQRKTAEQQRQTAISHGFYGSDPTDKTVYQFLSRAFMVDKVLSPNGPGMNLWRQSYRAAHEARLLAQAITVLNQQQVNVLNWLAAVQNEEQARQAAEAEARRVEAERMRLAAEEEARRIARLEALAQAQRKAEEQARQAAEVARQHVAAEQARLAEQVRLAAQQQAQELERQTAQAESRRIEAERARLDAEQQEQRRQAANVHPVSGLTAATGPVFSFASRPIALPSATSAAILSVLRSALTAAAAAGTALLGPVLVGFAALLAPSRLANGERFAMSVPLTELSAENTQTLNAIADRQGTLDLPVGLGFRTTGLGAELFVVTAHGFDIRSSVPVMRATYDVLHNVYRIALPDSPTDTLTWTPAVTQGNSSTERPIVQPDAPAYSGAPVVPLEGRVDLHPTLVEGWDRFIVVFPDDAGVVPLYVVFSSPYEGATVVGEHSGRASNPEQAGGPTLEMEWDTVVAAQEGVNAVTMHISRFPSSDANKVMLDRLEKVLRGELEMTDTDRRFYTHELRELERFRALGYGDTETPDPDSPVWNNVHTATLEDYKLKDDPSLLYTAEALAAAKEQDERDYQTFLKEIL